MFSITWIGTFEISTIRLNRVIFKQKPHKESRELIEITK